MKQFSEGPSVYLFFIKIEIAHDPWERWNAVAEELQQAGELTKQNLQSTLNCFVRTIAPCNCPSYPQELCSANFVNLYLWKIKSGIYMCLNESFHGGLHVHVNILYEILLFPAT